MTTTTQIHAFRTSPTWRFSENLQVDRNNLVIRNLVAMQADVEALGHGCMTDRRTLELMVALAATPGRRPIRGRFGHPGMSENATGRQVMRTNNYRLVTDVRGTFLIHDAQLLAAARKSPVFGQDPIEYILSIAETAPTEFGESVVVEADLVWTRPAGVELPLVEAYTDERGEPQTRRNGRPPDALTTLPVLRPTKFLYCDFVNEGALTHGGLFSMTGVFDGHSAAYASELFDLVDRWRAAYRIELDDLSDKVHGLLDKYVHTRKEMTTMAKTVQFEVDDQEIEGGEGLDGEMRSASESKADSSLERSQQMLRRAEKLATSLSAGEQEIEARARFATVDDLAEMRQTVESQAERISELSMQLRKTAELLERSMTAISAMQRNMLRMDGEPVVTSNVNMNAGRGGLEPLQFSSGHPRPGSSFAEGKGGSAAQTAEQRAIETQQRRARAAGQGK